MVSAMPCQGFHVVALSALALALSACGANTKTDASKDIAKFLDAARRADRQAFAAGLDRAEVQSDIRGQVVALARMKGVDIDGGPSEFAIDRIDRCAGGRFPP